MLELIRLQDQELVGRKLNKRKNSIRRLFTVKNLSDEELVEKIRSEDSELFAEIIERYQQKLYRYLRYLTNRPSEAEDILQDVFIKAYRNLLDFNTKKKFSAWIYRIAHNEGVNFIKRLNRRKEISLQGLGKIDFPANGKNNSLLDVQVRKEIKEKVKKCLDELETKYREPLILYYLEDKHYLPLSLDFNWSSILYIGQHHSFPI
ncbi:hypothetical protein ES702_01518 [subsurface metagenome]